MANNTSPLDQFKVKKIIDLEIFNIDISLTNSALYMILSSLAVIILLFIFSTQRNLYINKRQFIGESIYRFIYNLSKNTIGDEHYLKFLPLIFSLFAFIALCNILGLTPYSFTSTSQIIVTASLSSIAFLTMIIFAFYKKGFFGFFKLFLPSGVPIFMAPFIFIIELFSFLIRPVTLSVRLFANMVAGHVLLKVISSFVVLLGVAGIFPIIFIVIMIGFELFVAILQAYIFAILVSAYLSDIVREH